MSKKIVSVEIENSIVFGGLKRTEVKGLVDGVVVYSVKRTSSDNGYVFDASLSGETRRDDLDYFDSVQSAISQVNGTVKLLK